MHIKSTKKINSSTSKWRNTFTFIALFAMCLSILAQTAPLWAKKIDGQRIEICSAFGSRTILVDENFSPIPEKPEPKKQTRKQCDVCFVTTSHITPPLTLGAGQEQTASHKITYPHFNISGITKSEYSPRNSRAPPRHS